MPQPKRHVSAAARQAAYRQRCEQARQAALAAKGLPSRPVLATMPGEARWKAAWTRAQELIAETLGEMEDYYEERTERWQESPRGEQHQERIAAVEAILDTLGELIP